MAISKDQLTVEVVLDSSGAVKGIKDLQGQFVEFDKIVQTSSKSSNQANESTGRMGEIFSGVSSKLSQAAAPLLALQAAVGLASAAFNAVKSTVSEFVDAYADAEKAQVMLTRAIENAGGRIQNSAAAWGEYLDALQETKAVDADVLRGFVAQAIQMGFSEKQTKDLVSAMIGLSKVTGDSLDSSFQKLIGTTRGMARGLSAMIPELQNLNEQELRSGDAFEIVAGKFKNAADGAGTYTYAVKQAALAGGELKEDIGRIIIETFSFTSAMQSTTDTINSVRSALAAVDVKSLRENFVEFVKNAGPTLVFIGGLTAALTGLSGALMAAVTPVVLITAKILLIVGAVTAVITIIEMLANNIGILKDVLNIAASTIALAFMSMARNIAEDLDKLFSLFGDNNPFAKAANQVAAGLQKSVDSLKDSIGKSTANIRTEFNKTFTADLFKQVGNAIDGFKGKVDTTKKSLKDLGTEGARVKVIDEKMLERAESALKDIIKQTDQLRLSAALAGKDEIEQIKIKAQEQLRAVDAKKKELEQQGLLNEKLSAALADQKQAVIENMNQTIQIAERNKLLEEQKKLNSELKSITDNVSKSQEQIRMSNLGTFDVIRQQSVVELEKIAALERQLELAGGLTEEKKAEIEAAKQGIKEIESAKTGQAIMSGVNSAISAAQGGADALMGNVINQIGAAFGPEGQMIAGVVNLLRKGKEFTKELAKGFYQILQDLPRMLSEGAVGLIEGITEGFLSIFGDPKSTEQFILNLVNGAVQIVEALVRATPQITIALARPSLWISVAKALVKAVIDAIPELLKAFRDSAKTFGKEIGAATSKAFKDAMQVFSKVGEIIWTSLKDGASALWDVFKQFGAFIWDGLKGLFGEVGKSFSSLGTSIYDGLVAALSGAWDFFKSIGNAIKDGLAESFDWIADKFRNFGRFIWEGLKSIIRETVGKLADWLGLAEGGIVPGTARLAGDNPANDTVPALLSPGEAVIPRSLMANPQINQMISDLLSNRQMPVSMNQALPRVAMANGGIVPALRGGTSFGDTNLNVVLQIETKEPLDEGFIRQRLMPALKAELKASSLRGDFVLSAKGVRG